ncbi:MAG: hypothetical protein JWN36_3321 [Microbacteriaceae bacterium]|nr:hypothetical protein [Microbacteriaceae bacterium]
MTGLTEAQRTAWRSAQALWGVQLHDPLEKSDAHMDTFAWFSFPPQVHFDLKDAERRGLGGYFESIFAHEIGHHVLSPSTRLDSLKIAHQMARAISASGAARLAHPESYAQQFSNLWSDMLINVRVARLQRERSAADEPQMVSMWRALSAEPTTDRLWWVVLRAYEQLWSKPPGFLVPPDPPAAPPQEAAEVPVLDEGPPNEDPEKKSKRLAAQREAIARLAAVQRELASFATTNPVLDASLLADTVRTFGDDPISGALRFGMIATPYLVEGARDSERHDLCGGQVGGGPATPGELVAVLGDARLREEPRHPALEAAEGDAGTGQGDGQGYGLAKTLELYSASSADAVVAAWYETAARQWVRPMVQPSQSERLPDATIPGALDEWSLGDDLADLDWPASLSTSATIIPGVTTRRRDMLPDSEPDAVQSVQLDLYIDSSGSMTDPRRESPAVLAGTILILSVLRGGGRVRVTSFAGPGQVAGSAGFTRNRADAMRDLCFYFAGSTTFPLDVYGARYSAPAPHGQTRRHVVVLSDDGLLSMFGEGQPQYAAVAARVRSVIDTGTLVVQDSRHAIATPAAAAGYDVEYIASMREAPAACARLARRLARPLEVQRG